MVLETGREMTGAEKKSQLLARVSQLAAAVKDNQNYLRTVIPHASNLTLSKELERLARQVERVQMEVQALIL